MKLSEKEYYELLELAHKQIKTYKYLRLGQALFNILYEHNPDLANSIRSTEADPFYNDNIELFKKAICK